jgi:hypothetical protein
MNEYKNMDYGDGGYQPVEPEDTRYVLQELRRSRETLWVRNSIKELLTAETYIDA